MKAAALIYTSPDGKFKAVPSDSLGDLIDLAKTARATGLIDGGAVLEGSVLANWRNAPAYQFRCTPKIVAGALSGLKGRKVKASV